MIHSHGPILCPGCRKLISSDEDRCPHCGLSHPGRLSKPRTWLRRYQSAAGWTTAVVNLNIGIYVVSLLLSRSISGLSADPFSILSPDDNSLLLLGATGVYPIERLHRWWSLVSANFLHGSLLHIFLNMAAVTQIGPLVFRQYGFSRTSSIYLLGGAAGFLLSFWAGVVVTIGASASVCGLLGALFYYGCSRGGPAGRVIVRQMSAAVFMLFIFGMIIPGINNWGHGGGFLAGVCLAFLLGHEQKRRESRFHRFLGIGCILATALILVHALMAGLAGRFI